MIELLLKNGEHRKFNTVNELTKSEFDFSVMQLIGYDDTELHWLEQTYGLDLSIMKQYEDIEISSHFSENKQQAFLHFSIPYYDQQKYLVEEPLFIIISLHGIFILSTFGLDRFINTNYLSKASLLQQASDNKEIMKFFIGFIADYYADITENLAKKIKNLANKILIEKEFTDEVMDVITNYNFNNLLIKESLIETIRVFNLYKKCQWESKIGIRDVIEQELNDLGVVSDYIQFNFDRLDDLKENVFNKIDVEQNRIFKILTVITACISLPTLIAGIYGMNFDSIPGSSVKHGFLISVVGMIACAILPYVYFKRKKWL